MIKKLASCIGEYKKASILTPLFVTLEVIMEIIIPIIMAKLIDDGINAGNMSTVYVYGGILVVLCALSLFFGAASGWYAAEASAGFAKNLRRKMYYRIQNYSFSNIDKFSSSSLVTRLTTDVTNVQNSFQMIIRIAVRSPAMLIFSLAVSFSINARLALIFLLAVPVLGVGFYFIMTNAHPLFKRVFKTYDKLNRVVQENLHGVRVVKSFVREEHEIEKFDTVSDDIYETFTKAEKLINLNAPLMQFAMYACSLLVSFFGARMILSDNTYGMTTGLLTSLISYATWMLMSLMMLSMIFAMITISRASAERIVEVLDEESDIKDKESFASEVKNGAISFKNVFFSYAKRSEKPVLSDISLDIASGQTVGIIGGTGSAKSSLVQLIPRLYDVSSGEVTVGGIDVREYSIKVLRDSVAMVLQKNLLFSGTIKDNLRWGNENASDKELEHACRLAQAHDFISGFPDGYDTMIEQGGANVSGGQRQRLCIARALLKNPKIIILDDSTSAVDTKTDTLIREGFAKDLSDTTKIIIAQRIASVEKADMIVVLDDGKISAVGKHDELLEKSNIYREVYDSQTKGGELK